MAVAKNTPSNFQQKITCVPVPAIILCQTLLSFALTASGFTSALPFCRWKHLSFSTLSWGSGGRMFEMLSFSHCKQLQYYQFLFLLFFFFETAFRLPATQSNWEDYPLLPARLKASLHTVSARTVLQRNWGCFREQVCM